MARMRIEMFGDVTVRAEDNDVEKKLPELLLLDGEHQVVEVMFCPEENQIEIRLEIPDQDGDPAGSIYINLPPDPMLCTLLKVILDSNKC